MGLFRLGLADCVDVSDRKLHSLFLDHEIISTRDLALLRSGLVVDIPLFLLRDNGCFPQEDFDQPFDANTSRNDMLRSVVEVFCREHHPHWHYAGNYSGKGNNSLSIRYWLVDDWLFPIGSPSMSLALGIYYPEPSQRADISDYFRADDSSIDMLHWLSLVPANNFFPPKMFSKYDPKRPLLIRISNRKTIEVVKNGTRHGLHSMDMYFKYSNDFDEVIVIPHGYADLVERFFSKGEDVSPENYKDFL